MPSAQNAPRVKLVIDTNTLISGSLWEGPSASLLEAVERGTATLITSPALLAEFAEVLSRPKFALRIATRGTSAAALSRKLGDKASLVTPVVLPLPPALRDPKDLPVLACAVAAEADAIVTGDKDLLVLASFRGIPIITAQQALQRLSPPPIL
jgi:putative PIN family toxin of toxin-antitoxin system